MLSVTKRITPALRFCGFDGEWEVKEFGSVVARSGTASAEPALPRLEYEDIVSGAGVVNKDLSRKESLKSGLLFGPGDVLYGKLRPYLKNWLLPDFHGIAVGDFWVLQSLTADPKFLYQLIQTPMYDAVASISSGSKMPRADWKLVSQASMVFPSTIEEQRAIGELFADLDALIEQRRAKHANLQQTKTALLQRMFPQDCADEPELRLDGFSGAWQSRIMRDCAEYSKGSGYSKKDITDEGTPVIHYGRLYTDYETAITRVDTFASPQPGALISRGDEVLVPASGETAEDIAIASALLQPGVLIGGDLNVIRPCRNIDPVFLALNLSNGAAKETLVKRAQGKSVVHLRNSDIQDVEIFFPTLEEQRAIGEVFFNLDALIAAESRFITQLTQAKTALLQRMFV